MVKGRITLSAALISIMTSSSDSTSPENVCHHDFDNGCHHEFDDSHHHEFDNVHLCDFADEHHHEFDDSHHANCHHYGNGDFGNVR